MLKPLCAGLFVSAGLLGLSPPAFAQSDNDPSLPNLTLQMTVNDEVASNGYVDLQVQVTNIGRTTADFGERDETEANGVVLEWSLASFPRTDVGSLLTLDEDTDAPQTSRLQESLRRINPRLERLTELPEPLRPSTPLREGVFAFETTPSSIQPGYPQIYEQRFAIPDRTLGHYVFCAHVDPNNLIIESEERDNQSCTEVLVRTNPDENAGIEDQVEFVDRQIEFREPIRNVIPELPNRPVRSEKDPN